MQWLCEATAAALRHYNNLLKEITARAGQACDEEAYVFVGMLKNNQPRRGDVPLSTHSIRRLIRYHAAETGITARVGGHSFRIGSAIELNARGADTVAIMQVGRWKSVDVVAGYILETKSRQGAMARLRQ